MKKKNVLLIYRGRVFSSEIKPKLEQYKDENIILVVEDDITKNIVTHFLLYISNKNVTLMNSNEFLDDKNKILKFMEFDVININPPYQDGKKDGGQNKIYMPICKKAMSLRKKDTGIMYAITPTSVLKKSKRFSLIGIPGLKIVDFTANEYFKEGVDICAWTIDSQYQGDVQIINSDNTIRFVNNNHLIDTSKIDVNFYTLYKKLKDITNSPKKRMFSQNAVDTKTGRRKLEELKQKDSTFKYDIYKLHKNQPVLIQYNKPIPKFYGENKFIISMTKSLSDDSTLISKNDFDVAHLCININNIDEVNNIKSFIFSEYFKNHSNMWKSMDGYGYNYALKYLPPFDKTKKWTNDEVKQFIESFLND